MRPDQSTKPSTTTKMILDNDTSSSNSPTNSQSRINNACASPQVVPNRVSSSTNITPATPLTITPTITTPTSNPTTKTSNSKQQQNSSNSTNLSLAPQSSSSSSSSSSSVIHKTVNSKSNQNTSATVSSINLNSIGNVEGSGDVDGEGGRRGGRGVGGTVAAAETQPSSTAGSTSATNNPGSNLSNTNLYIRGLQESTTDQDLYNMCSRYGHITSTKAILEPDTGKCKGYGFIDFANSQAASVAVKEMTESGIQATMARLRQPIVDYRNYIVHRKVNHTSVRRNGYFFTKNPPKNTPDETNLYIANLPLETGEAELEALLSPIGTVVSTRILRDERNNPRGVGFARMASLSCCDRVMEELGGRRCEGSTMPLLIKFADGPNRKRHLYNSHKHQNQHNNNQHYQKNSFHEDNRWDGVENTTAPVANAPVIINNDVRSEPACDSRGNMSQINESNVSGQGMAQNINYDFQRYPRGLHSTAPMPAGYASVGPPTSTAHWMHHTMTQSQAGQHYVIPQQMLPPGTAFGPSGQAVPYGTPLTQLTTQMQALQMSPTGHPVGAYMPPPPPPPPQQQHHQWQSHPMWLLPMPRPPAAVNTTTTPTSSMPEPPAVD